VLTEGEVPHSREERYADHFGRCFVTPARAVRQRFAEITAGQSHLTRRHIILLASAFGVAREAIVRRLEELGLAKRGTWDWFQANGGITDEQARQVLGELPVRGSSLVEAQGAVPPRLALLAREGWKRGFYSEGQLARLLKLDRHEVRELLDGAEHEESEANELVKLPY
ncbi:MAG: ImmA/IrrE family metallo-endopeptidase, partial [Beijerinckiaceae bacterium]